MSRQWPQTQLLFQEKPRIFGNPRLHYQGEKYLGCPPRQRCVIRLLHLQEEEEEKLEQGGSAKNKKLCKKGASKIVVDRYQKLEKTI